MVYTLALPTPLGDLCLPLQGSEPHVDRSPAAVCWPSVCLSCQSPRPLWQWGWVPGPSSSGGSRDVEKPSVCPPLPPWRPSGSVDLPRVRSLTVVSCFSTSPAAGLCNVCLRCRVRADRMLSVRKSGLSVSRAPPRSQAWGAPQLRSELCCPQGQGGGGGSGARSLGVWQEVSVAGGRTLWQ